ncbi:N-acetyltransferase eco [Gryllus bimaculatus]|nr:N-acetyltransferase eco [Gryllus bimaculatus]
MDARQYVILTNSASKRSLFPSRPSASESSDEDSLGHMSPLKSSSPDRYSSPRYSPLLIEETPCKMDTSHDDSLNNLQINKVCRNFNSVLRDSTPQKISTEVIGDTPEKETRSDMLTPFKCLIQRRNIEETPDSTITKTSDAIRKLCWKKKEHVKRSPEKNDDSEKKDFDFNSNIANLIKNSFYRPANSKAKTALFPEKLSKPTVNAATKINRRRHVTYTHHGGLSRNSHKRPRVLFGEINAGVRHRVKKPKPKFKRHSEIVRKSIEKPLISPEDRVEKYIRENEFLDEGNVPSKRPRIEEVSLVNSYNNGLKTLAAQELHTSVNSPAAREIKNARKSPEVEIAPDPTKKFFKTNRTMAIDHKATVTVVNNVKIQVHKGKLALGNSPSRIVKPVKKRPVVLEDVFEEDSATTLATSVVQETVKEVLQKLDNEIETSVADDSHHIQSITTSTSSLALHDGEIVNASGRACVGEYRGIISESVNDEENKNPENVAGTPDGKLYPVFYKRKGLFDSSNTVRKSSPHIKKMRLIGEDQYQIDAGQSRFRAVNCKECGTLYHLGDPEDEIAHYNIHNNISTFRFVGWKHEHVIKLYENGERIIVIYPDDPKAWVNKAKDVLNVIDKEMGFVDGSLMEIGSNKVYLYVLKNRIVGVLAAEPKREAYRMINTGIDGPDCCSEETYSVQCGISRIWTAPDLRRKGIASKLVDSLRLSFMFDHILDKKEIAFSVPTENGKAFATNYMKTSEFMVYYK